MNLFEEEKNDKRNVGLYIDSLLADRCQVVADTYGVSFNKAVTVMLRTGLVQAEKELREINKEGTQND